MLPRRTLHWPITLGIVMIVLLVALTGGWVLLGVRGGLADAHWSGLYWTLLSVGSAFFVLMLVGVSLYLALVVSTIRLNQRQSNFIDSVTHELKSPIASLKLYLQTLNRRQVTEEQRTDFNRFMLEDVERLDRLINQMLVAGQLDRRPVESDVEDVELGPLLDRCARGVCSSYRVPNTTVQLDVQPAVVRARPWDVEMIARNLIDNAVKYAGTEPEVRVEAKPAGDATVVVRILDNGCGIPPKLRRKIFGRFVRLSRDSDHDKPGTGLGLYIVRTLVKRIGGRIQVRDREDSSGTVFEVTLPAAQSTNGALGDEGELELEGSHR